MYAKAASLTTLLRPPDRQRAHDAATVPFWFDLLRQPSSLRRMSKIANHACGASPAARKRIRRSMKSIAGLLVLALLMPLSPARADDPDEEYLQIFRLIQEADELDASAKTAPARAKYQEAHTALRSFQKSHRDWNVKMVSTRLNYLAQKMAALAEKPPPDAAAAATATASVKLLEAGTEPRKVLRLHPTPGDKQSLSLTVKMAGETKVTGAETSAGRTGLPEVKMTLDSNVKEVSDAGNITYELVVGDLGLSKESGAAPAVAAAMEAAFAGVKGLSGTCTVSSRGFSNGVELKAPAGSNPVTRQLTDQMKELFIQLVVLMPEEAVGPGAKWEVKMPVKTQGMTIDQTATYELVSLEGERLTTKSTIVQSAANQKIQTPGMPAGVKVDLTKMTGKGTGERTFDLTHVLPTAGTGNSHTETSLAIDLGAKKEVQTVKMDVDLRFEAK